MIGTPALFDDSTPQKGFLQINLWKIYWIFFILTQACSSACFLKSVKDEGKPGKF
jgi:hypothetical protein